VNAAAEPQPAVFRLPRTAYLIVLFVALGTIPIAFTAAGYGRDSSGGLVGPPAVIGWQTALLVVPVLAAVFIARTATFVDTTGVRVRAAFGSRQLRWDDIRGLSIDGNDVYAIVAGGAVRLPCVHLHDLAAVSRAAGGHLPELAEPKPKFAPQKGRRRR
jgi:hypothetical protein